MAMTLANIRFASVVRVNVGSPLSYLHCDERCQLIHGRIQLRPIKSGLVLMLRSNLLVSGAFRTLD